MSSDIVTYYKFIHNKFFNIFFILIIMKLYNQDLHFFSHDVGFVERLFLIITYKYAGILNSRFKNSFFDICIPTSNIQYACFLK